MEAKRFLNPKEFRARTGRSLKTIYRRLSAGKLPAFQEGGPGTGWLIDFDAYLAGSATPLPVAEDCSTESAVSVQEGGAALKYKTPDLLLDDETISGPQPAWMRFQTLTRK